tara:strand:- start:868 stop:1713 length:846 start_codon:yes stop_codon:yes gene_type:complete
MSVRNNEERLGAAPNEDSPAISQNLQDPLNFAVPTMHVDIPSKGKYYAPEHPLHEQESIEIRFMTAKDEDILTSPNLIKKGLVLDRLAQSLILDKRIKVQDLLLGDKNAVLIQARITGYGPWYEATVTCPSCSEEQVEEFDLNECIELKESESSFDEIDDLGHGYFIVSLPATKVQCKIKLLRGKEEKILMKDFGKKNKKEDNFATQQLKLMLETVNGKDDPKVINYFAENMPISDSRFLRFLYEKVNPNASLKASFTCESCAHSEDLEVPLTTDFFWPKQ